MSIRISAHKTFIALAFAACLSEPAVASSITFLGLFQHDNQESVFQLDVSETTDIDIRSIGYAGGLTDVGGIIAGGFDTYLTLFDGPTGAFIAENDDGVNTALDPSTGQAFDAELVLTLNPGRYAVYLTQSGNYALGQNDLDGFSESSNASYTIEPGFAPGGNCLGSGFKDASGACRTGYYAVEFLNMEHATASFALTDEWEPFLPETSGSLGALSVSNSIVSGFGSPVPEPSSFALLLIALVTVYIVRRGCGKTASYEPIKT